jgi:hypothetical protein
MGRGQSRNQLSLLEPQRGRFRARRRTPAPAPTSSPPARVGLLQDFDRRFDALVTAVEQVHRDKDDYSAWMAKHTKMTRYDPGLVEEILDQCPTATRIAGERAWKTRGRRLRPGAKPIMIGAGRKLTRPPVHPRTGMAIDNPRLQRALGLKPELVGYARTQLVYDIAATEPVEPQAIGAATEAACRRALADICAVAAANGIHAYPGGASEGAALRREINRNLINDRDAEGISLEYRLAGKTTRVIATPGGLDPVEEVRCMAHELAHALGDHRGSLRRFLVEDYETQAESFAHQLAGAYGLSSPTSPYYLVNRGGVAPARRLKWNRDAVRKLAEKFDRSLGSGAGLAAA